MTDQPDQGAKRLGTQIRTDRTAISGIELAAAGFTVLWLALSGGYFLLAEAGSAQVLQFVLMLIVIVFPIALIWVAVAASRSSRILREESARLEIAIDALRKSYIQQNQNLRDGPIPAINRKLDEIAAAQKKAETTLAMITSTHVAAASVAAEPSVLEAAPNARGDRGEQPALALGTPAEELAEPLSRGDFIRALHFPETAEDMEGFAALRRALKDRQTGQLVQASQDVLTLLSQDGIYMDDLRPDLARPEVWRKFAAGERGRGVALLGGVRDRSSLALTAGRMKKDTIFRDAVHHFLRVFDKVFVAFEAGATDSEITEFGNTRTARAFMLLGRVAGTFD